LKTREEFLEELKSQYEMEFELKNSLETKANYNLVASGVVVGLLFTFGVALLDTFNWVPNIQMIFTLLLLSIGSLTISILFSVLVLRIKGYYFTFLPNYFYNGDNFDYEAINEYRDMDYDMFLNKRIELYLKANKTNFKENENKATKIEIAHWLFFGGIILVLITVLIFSLSAKAWILN
jgi:hypothetical protein